MLKIACIKTFQREHLNKILRLKHAKCRVNNFWTTFFCFFIRRVGKWKRAQKSYACTRQMASKNLLRIYYLRIGKVRCLLCIDHWNPKTSLQTSVNLIRGIRKTKDETGLSWYGIRLQFAKNVLFVLEIYLVGLSSKSIWSANLSILSQAFSVNFDKLIYKLIYRVK